MIPFIHTLAILGLIGVAGVAVGCALIGAGMPLLLLVGMIDGPTGGRLAERRVRTPARRVLSTASPHAAVRWPAP